MSFRRSPYREGLTKADKLLAILMDRAAHSTQELVRRVGHAFGGAIFKLRSRGFSVQRTHHPTKRYQSEYRLTDDKSRSL